MELSARERRMIRRLNRPAHQFGFHLAAAIVMVAGGVLSAAQALQAGDRAGLWMACLVGAIGVFWAERLVTTRMHQRLIAKLILIRQAPAPEPLRERI